MSLDFITSMIITAATYLGAGMKDGLAEVAKLAIVEGYEYGLKPILRRKFGANSRVMEAISRIENAPDTRGLPQVLQGELAAVNAQDDAEVLAAAKQLHETFIRYHLQIIGNTNAFYAPFTATPLPQPPYPPRGQSEPGSVQALAGMIVGILAMIICVVPLFGGVTAVAGIIVSALAWRAVSRRGMVTTGLALSIIALVVNLLIDSSLIFHR